MGGEKERLARCAAWAEGSPPRGRGKVSDVLELRTADRITPAWAGKSYVFGPLWPGSWDHPRVGGEKTRGFFNPPDSRGSPPRGRGKGWGFCLLSLPLGITPAWAGKRP